MARGRVVLSLAAAGLRCALQYRANFLATILTGLVYQGTGFVFIWVVLSRFRAIAGWTLGDIAFLYGLRLMIHALTVLIFGQLDGLNALVRRGEFDRFLVRPLPPLLQVVTQRVSVGAFGDLLGGVALFLAATSVVSVAWSPALLVYLALAMAGGCLMEAALKLVAASLAFRLLNTTMLVFLVDDVFNNFGTYPLQIYGAVVRWFLIFGIPVAFVAYFPATVLLGRVRDLDVIPLFADLAPLAGFIWFSLAYLFFRYEVRNYQSSGH
jgi:ABC-2 type transport system permease protein